MPFGEGTMKCPTIREAAGIHPERSVTKTVLVAGAGGFIGGHLVADLLRKGHRVRAVDIKPFEDWHQFHADTENVVADLSRRSAANAAVRGVDRVYNLSCNMGGAGFTASHRADCSLNVLINTHLLMAAKESDVDRFFFSSTACVYNIAKQEEAIDVKLKESDAYPSMPEPGYGDEKLFSEKLCEFFRGDYGIETRVARFHNIYGPCGDFDSGREKAPAAICRKVIHAKLSGENAIEIWGDGNQTRSFAYIDDCIRGINDVTDGLFVEPVNLGSAEGVTINQLVGIAEEIAGVKLERRYNLDAPRGVNGRNSDNTLFRSVYGWEPSIPLREGLEKTYRWIYDKMRSRYQ